MRAAGDEALPAVRLTGKKFEIDPGIRPTQNVLEHNLHQCLVALRIE